MISDAYCYIFWSNDLKLALRWDGLKSKLATVLTYKITSDNRLVSKVTTLFHKLSRDMGFPQCGMCDKQSLRSACAYAQSDQSLCLSLEYPMSVKLLTEHHLVS